MMKLRPTWNPRDLPTLAMWFDGQEIRTRPYPPWLRKVRAQLGGWR